ncbi:MAG TPA: hypothetical protein VGC50_16890 [Gammaproteobacteria bacterium]|jgi:hypothetical protein
MSHRLIPLILLTLPALTGLEAASAGEAERATARAEMRAALQPPEPAVRPRAEAVGRKLADQIVAELSETPSPGCGQPLARVDRNSQRATESRRIGG